VRERQGNDDTTSLGHDKAIETVYFKLKERLAGKGRFTGYDEIATTGTVLALLVGGKEVEQASEGDDVEFVTDATPFYAESGGQIGDTGRARNDTSELDIADTIKPTGDLHVHRGKLARGTLKIGDALELQVDTSAAPRSAATTARPTCCTTPCATCSAPTSPRRARSSSPDRLRFDFSHARPLTREQKQEIERQVNAAILQNRASDTQSLSMPEAKETGARSACSRPSTARSSASSDRRRERRAVRRHPRRARRRHRPVRDRQRGRHRPGRAPHRGRHRHERGRATCNRPRRSSATPPPAARRRPAGGPRQARAPVPTSAPASARSPS
jgi:Ser-tRNA(Ala) deacylase AlaX